MSSVAENGNATSGDASSGQDATLTEAEQKQVTRLLSDPTYFPVEFRTWLKTYLEGSGIQFPSSAIMSGPSTQKSGLPPGTILPFAGGTIPPDCKTCDGSALSRTVYKKLFDVIGTSWGAGDGTSTFNIPDLRDRAIYGAGSVVGFSAHDGNGAGSRGGPYHHHGFGTSTDGGGGHDHDASISGGSDGGGSHSHTGDAWSIAQTGGGTFTHPTGGATRIIVTTYGRTDDQGSHSHGISGSGGTSWDGDHDHWVSGDTEGGYDDQPSFAGMHYVVATGVVV